MEATPEEILELVKASPARVAEHDKAGWLDLFAASAVVEDPVGAAPNRKGEGLRGGQDQLGRFYDTFIAPNEIHFEVIEDILCGREVARDVTIHTRLSTGLEVAVPAHLLYEVTREGGALKLRRLAAHWELAKMSAQAMSQGLRGLITMPLMSWTMLRVQGPGWMLGYSRALHRGIFGRGKRAARRLGEAVSSADVDAIRELFEGSDARIEHPVGSLTDAEGLLEALGAGARLEVSQEISAGWSTSFRFQVRGGVGEERGIGFLAFDPRSKRISSARLFVQERRGE